MILKFMARQCRVCGFPWLISNVMSWNDNGTITIVMQPEMKAVILHQDFIDALFSGIGARLGVSIEHIAFEAQRNAAKEVFDSTFNMIPGMRFALRFKPVKRFSVRYFNLVASDCGMCHSDVVNFEGVKSGVSRITNPFYMPMLAANVVGAFEAMERVPYKAEWEESGPDTYMLKVEQTGEKPEIAQRMDLHIEPSLPGKGRLESCSHCRAPRGLSHLEWKPYDGMIIDSRTKSRVLLLDGHTVSAVFREIRRELGDEIDELLMDAQRQWTIAHVSLLGPTPTTEPLSPEKLSEAYVEYLSMLPLHGHGNPVSFKAEDGSIELVVENPYDPFLLAGTIKGLYEALEKTESDVSREEVRPGVSRFVLKPA